MNERQQISIIYHSIFGAAPGSYDLKKWEAGPSLRLRKRYEIRNMKYGKSYVLSRNSCINKSKIKIAKRASGLLSRVPSVLFVGITGSLAMNNAKPSSDIDLMVITSANSLWISRAISYFLLFIFKVKLRTPKNSSEKDKVCLNLWIDETELLWEQPKNAYIAHEIAQVIPLVNKHEVYERWLFSNKWIRSYWPSALGRRDMMHDTRNMKESHTSYFVFRISNFVCYFLQRAYMSKKMTRESVSLHHAFFHPYDWGERVMKELRERGVVEVPDIL